MEKKGKDCGYGGGVGKGLGGGRGRWGLGGRVISFLPIIRLRLLNQFNCIFTIVPLDFILGLLR